MASAQTGGQGPDELSRGFRPGTAAAPYEWASAIADFDADGRPDVAVADHINGRDGATYQIEFHLSRGRSQVVSFASAQPALTVTAVDVDNDHDIDLVVTPVLSRDVVGVWLNDGAGHFRQSDPEALPSSIARFSTARIGGRAPQFAIATFGRRRVSPARPMPVATALCDDSMARVPSFAALPPTRILIATRSPRAPPSRV